MANEFISERGLSVAQGGGDNAWHAAMDPRVNGAVGPSVPDLLRISSTLRLAAGAKDPMVSLEQMCAIDPAARTIPGAGHNAHWEMPAQVWDFINNKN